MASPATERRLMTFEEAARLDPDEAPGELDEGKWIPMTKGTWRHGVIVLNAGMILRAYARTNSGWSVSVGDPGTKLERNPDTLRGPDVAIVRTDRVPTGRGASDWLEGSPDVVVEVIGDAQPASSLAKKALEYLSAGAKLVWVLDPEPGNVMEFSPGGKMRVLGSGESLDGGEALPGFSCRVDELFE